LRLRSGRVRRNRSDHSSQTLHLALESSEILRTDCARRSDLRSYLFIYLSTELLQVDGLCLCLCPPSCSTESSHGSQPPPKPFISLAPSIVSSSICLPPSLGVFRLIAYSHRKVGKEDGENTRGCKTTFDWVGVNPPFSRSSAQPGQVVEPGGWLRLLTGEAYAAATPAREREALAS